MPLLMITGGLVARLIDKFKWIPFLGAAVICFTAARMIFEDQFIQPRLAFSQTLIIAISIAVGILFPLVFTAINNLRSNAASLQKNRNQ
jgi:predicted tellurium resistance membrane protein TerC